MKAQENGRNPKATAHANDIAKLNKLFDSCNANLKSVTHQGCGLRTIRTMKKALLSCCVAFDVEDGARVSFCIDCIGFLTGVHFGGTDYEPHVKIVDVQKVVKSSYQGETLTGWEKVDEVHVRLSDIVKITYID